MRWRFCARQPSCTFSTPCSARSSPARAGATKKFGLRPDSFSASGAWRLSSCSPRKKITSYLPSIDQYLFSQGGQKGLRGEARENRRAQAYFFQYVERDDSKRNEAYEPFSPPCSVVLRDDIGERVLGGVRDRHHQAAYSQFLREPRRMVVKRDLRLSAASTHDFDIRPAHLGAPTDA